MVALFVAITFILFIAVDILILKVQRKKHPALYNPDIPVFNKRSFHFPAELLLSKGHTWIKILKDGIVEVGIDDFIIKALGKLSVINLAKEGAEIKTGDVILQAVVDKKSLNFRSPINGLVKKVNSSLIGQAIEDPYTNWGIIVVPAGIDKDRSNLMEGKQLADWLKNEVVRLKDFLSLHTPKIGLVGVTMHDGGNIVEGAVANIDETGIEDFEKEFLTF